MYSFIAWQLFKKLWNRCCVKYDKATKCYVISAWNSSFRPRVIIIWINLAPPFLFNFNFIFYWYINQILSKISCVPLFSSTVSSKKKNFKTCQHFLFYLLACGFSQEVVAPRQAWFKHVLRPLKKSNETGISSCPMLKLSKTQNFNFWQLIFARVNEEPILEWRLSHPQLTSTTCVECFHFHLMYLF